MCASYGLDPRFDGSDFIDTADEELLAGLRDWAEQNANETLRPTGKNLRNLNPIVTAVDDSLSLGLGWWGYLVDGEPAKFPSINTRSEHLQQRPASMPTRAIVPATNWFEMRKPERKWYSFDTGGLDLFGMAAVTQRGRATDGRLFTCYSIVMQPAVDHLFEIHDRMPLLIPSRFAREWLTSTDPAPILMQAALQAARPLAADINAHPAAR
ncbi:SOS response-associated peptidase family protein [Agromyces italicus]|uniref:SOS response-associated peptidase family protein n=1 Tax=Agromyces italicus TaxID=279572 RepID=UPI0003B7544F|nr:SOS response-associated peptidase family protein [Agromyces italicus]